MTDFTSRETVYYSADQYNNTSSNVEAQIDVSLQYPLVQQGNNYNVGISKAQFDLSTIPLTRTNIPLRTYEITLREGANEGSAYVRQINASANNFNYNLDPITRIFTKSTYSSTGTITNISTFTIPSNVATTFGSMVLDNYENIYLATNTDGTQIFNTLTILSPTGAVISQNSSFTSIACLSMSPSQILCIAANKPSESVVYVEQVQASVGSVTLTLINLIQGNKAGNLLTDLKTVAVDDHILIGYNDIDCTLYDTQTLTPLNDFQVTELTQMSNVSAILSTANRFVLTDSNSYDYLYGFASPAITIINTAGTVLAGPTYGTPNLSNVVYTGPNVGSIIGQTTTGTIVSIPYNDGSFGSDTVVSTSCNFNSLGVQNFGAGLDYIYGINWASNFFQYININDTAPSIPQIVCEEILVNPSYYTQVFFQNNTPNAWAISNGSLYTTNQLAPKLLFSTSLQGSNLYINKYSIPPVINGQSITKTQLAEYPITITGATLPLTAEAMCKQTGIGPQPYFSLYNDNNPSGSVSFVLKQNPATFATISSSVVSNGIYSGSQAYQMFEIEGQGIGVVFFDGTTASVQIYDYNVSLLAGGNQIAQAVPSGLGFSASALNVSGNKFVFLATGTILSVHDVTNPALITLVSQTDISALITGLPSGSTFSSFLQLICYDDGTNTGYFMGQSSLSPVYLGDLLCSFKFTNNTFTTFDSALVVKTGSYSQDTNLTANKNLGELYIQNSDNSVGVFNVTSQNIISTIAANGNLVADFMFVPDLIDGTFTWNNVTLSSFHGIQSLCFSQTNPNKMYVVNDLDNLLYQTNVNVPPPLAFTRVPNTPLTMTSISCGLPTQFSLNSTAYCYNLQEGQAYIANYNVPNEAILAIGKDRASYSGQGEFIVSTYHNAFTSLSPSAFTQNWTTPSSTAGFIYVKPGEDVYAGDVPVYDYETLVRYINAAFVEAYNSLVAAGGSGMISAPVMSLDPVSSKLTLTYPAPYSQAGNGILFNQALLQICKFPASPDTVDPGMYLLLLSPSSTSTTQTARSIYVFNQLDQILLVSNTIYIIGSLYANNLQNNILQDFTVPISDQPGNQGIVLYVQPNFVSTLTIGSNQPIQRIQLRVLYKYKDESTYPLLVAPNSNWTAKMMFIKKY